MDTTVDRVLEKRSRPADLRAIWLGPAGAAFALHLVLLGIAITAAMWPRKPPQPLEYVAVQVLPAPARGERRPTPPRPATPPPAAEPAETKPETKPEIKPEPEPKPVSPVPSPVKPAPKPAETKPETPAKPETKPAATPSQPATGESTPVPPAGTPEGSATGTSRLGYQVLGFETSTFPFSYYLEQVLNKVDEHWTRPPVEGPKALVFFRILRDGRVVDLELKESSGNRAFDLAALRAVTNASPLPPLPAGYREPTLSVHLIVR